jgi:RNA polymerase sigma-70 factor (ECF subfamily)
MKENPVSNEELFAAVCEGDHNAFDVLYKRFSSRLFSYARTVLRDEAKALDLVQQVFTSVYASRVTFNGKNFDAWIFSIARNACLREKHVDRRTTPLSDADVADTSRPDGLSEADLDVIRRAVDALGDDDRTIIRLRYFDDLSYADIALLLDISVSAAKVRVFRARRTLAAVLRPQFED